MLAQWTRIAGRKGRCCCVYDPKRAGLARRSRAGPCSVDVAVFPWGATQAACKCGVLAAAGSIFSRRAPNPIALPLSRLILVLAAGARRASGVVLRRAAERTEVARYTLPTPRATRIRMARTGMEFA